MLGSRNPVRTTGRPIRHLSAGRYLTPARYVVGWHQAGIVKVGSTWCGRQRYGGFLSRGAELLDLAHYPELGDSLEAEVWLQRRLAKVYPLAFSNRLEATDFLPNGGGWTECFRVPKLDWERVISLANERCVA